MKGFDYMVKITEKFYFDNDGTQYILVQQGTRPGIDRKTKHPTGELVNYTENIGYYSSIGAMLEKCSKLLLADKTKNEEITTISEYISEMKRLKNEFADLISSISI